MVIKSTSALDVIIHAVSPEFSGSGGGAAAKADPVVSAKAPRPAPMPSPIRFQFVKRIACSPFDPNDFAKDFEWRLKRIPAGLPPADAHDLFEPRDEHLSFAHLAGPCPRRHGLAPPFRHFAFFGDFHLELWHGTLPLFPP